MVRPPRLMRFLVARLVPDDLRQDFLADLDELFQRRVAESGAARARRTVRQDRSPAWE